MNKPSTLSVIDSPFNTLIGVKTEEELFQSAAKLAKELGFDHFLFGLQVNASFIRPVRSVYENYPREWWLRYNQKNYQEIDPVLQHCLARTSPVIWSDELFAEGADELWEEAKSYGLTNGLTVPMHNRAGITGLLSLARDGRQGFSSAELATLVGQAYLFTCYLNDSATELLVPKMVSPSAAQLTERERECLLWSAEGKTAWEIGQILSISERTVIFHLKNAFQKLGAKNKTQALVRAVSMGLL